MIYSYGKQTAFSYKYVIWILLLLFCFCKSSAAEEAVNRAISTSPRPFLAAGWPKARVGTVHPSTFANTITFSEFPVGTAITDQYASIGIIFGGDAPFITDDGADPTSPVLSGSPLFEGTITGTFVDPKTGALATVNSLQLNAGFFDTLGSTLLSTFDAAGNLISSELNSQIGIETFLITSQTPIASWQIQIVGNEPNGFGIDNVEFDPPTVSATLEAIDARAAQVTFNQDSANATAASALVVAAPQMQGVAADGAATLLLRLTTTSPGTATFTVTGAGDATLDGQFFDATSGGSTQGASIQSVATALSSGMFQTYALYQAPVDYTHNTADGTTQRQVTVTANFQQMAGGAPITMTRTISIARPPIVLVHGFMSKPSRVGALRDQLGAAFPGLPILAVDYRNTASASFAANSMVVISGIDQVRTNEAEAGIVAVRADVVGHSLGGVLGRLLVEAPNYRRPDNLMLGDVHRLISLAAPYAGSFAADEIINFILNGPKDSVLKFVILLNAVGVNVAGGGLTDLQTTSAAIRLLQTTPAIDNTYEIQGNGHCADGLLVSKLFSLFSPGGISSPLPNDDFVTVASQGEGLTPPFQMLFPRCHSSILQTSIQNDPTVINFVGTLLSSPTSTFAPKFMTP
jgi:pimeloyl-ACP methyl ester carboxylesterase